MRTINTNQAYCAKSKLHINENESATKTARTYNVRNILLMYQYCYTICCLISTSCEEFGTILQYACSSLRARFGEENKIPYVALQLAQ